MSPEEVREILRMAQLPVSLEKPIGEEEESELGDFVEDEAAASPFDEASVNLRRATSCAPSTRCPIASARSSSCASACSASSRAPWRRWAAPSGSPASASARSRTTP